MAIKQLCSIMKLISILPNYFATSHVSQSPRGAIGRNPPRPPADIYNGPRATTMAPRECQPPECTACGERPRQALTGYVSSIQTHELGASYQLRMTST